MKIKLYNTTLEFNNVETLPANTELVSSEATVVNGYYYGDVGKTINFAPNPSGWITRLIPVRAGVTYKFKVAYCIPNANHVLFDVNKKLMQKWYIDAGNSYTEYTEFTPTEDGYIGVQCGYVSTPASLVNVGTCKKTYDWGTELP